MLKIHLRDVYENYMTVIIILYYYFSTVVFSRKICGTASHYQIPNEKHFKIIHSTTKYIIQIDFNRIVIISNEIYFRLKKTLLFGEEDPHVYRLLVNLFFFYSRKLMSVCKESPLR